MPPSYNLYEEIHQAVLAAGGKSHESLTPDPELVEFVASDITKTGAKAIDIGCGSGKNAVYLAKQGFEVTALELSSSGVRLAEGWARENQVSLEILQADATDLFTLLPDVFDFALDARCLQLIIGAELRHRFLRGVMNILCPGGWYFGLNIGFNDKDEAERLTFSNGAPEKWIFEGEKRIERLIPDIPVEPLWPEKYRAELAGAGFEIKEILFSHQKDRRPMPYQIRTLARKPK